MSRIRITRAVSYGRDDNGNLSISIVQPWDGFQRIRAFPPHVQEIVQGLDLRGRAYLMATVDETHKLWLAGKISEEVRAAVWDDILCQRAARHLIREAADNRLLKRHYNQVYGAFLLDPDKQRRRAHAR